MDALNKNTTNTQYPRKGGGVILTKIIIPIIIITMAVTPPTIMEETVE